MTIPLISTTPGAGTTAPNAATNSINPAITLLNSLTSGQTFTSAQVLASYPPASNAGQMFNTTDMGLLICDGARWLVATTPPIPPGAAVLGYKSNVYTVFPVQADISYSSATKTRLYSGYGPYGVIPPSGSYSTAANGQLGLEMTGGDPGTSHSIVTTQNAVNSQPLPGNLEYLPYLLAGQGFYVEIAVTLSGNNTDNHFAFFLEPQEHNTTFNDVMAGDPASYERWIEFDVNENGHGTDYSGAYRGAAISWKGFYAGAVVFTAPLTGTSGTISTVNGTGGGWPGDSGNYPFLTSTGQQIYVNVVKGSSATTWSPTITGVPTATASSSYTYDFNTSNIQTAALDYTTEHIFGMSYDPVGKLCTWWMDGVAQGTASTATANQGFNNWHYFPIITMESHGSNLAYTGTVRYFSAWAP